MKQKAAKKAGQQELARRAQQQAATQAATQATAQQQQHKLTQPAKQVAERPMEIDKMGTGQAARPAQKKQQAQATARAEAAPIFGTPSSSTGASLFGAPAPAPTLGLFPSARVNTLFKPAAEGSSSPKPGWGG